MNVLVTGAAGHSRDARGPVVEGVRRFVERYRSYENV